MRFSTNDLSMNFVFIKFEITLAKNFSLSEYD